MIRILKHPGLSIFATVLFCLPVSVLAQDGRPMNEAPPPDAPFDRPEGGPKLNLLRELGLSREQIQTIRRLNVERKPVEIAARRRFQDSIHELNTAIYSDSFDDESFQARLKEFQAAQAELARIKFSNELAVRRLLTPSQLVKFRELRQRFAEVRENFQKRRGDRNGQPVLRHPNRGGQQPPIN
ncbi:MAG: hypothetical protein ABIU09_07505 [Pyrinomonadaceae bacterium]